MNFQLHTAIFKGELNMAAVKDVDRHQESLLAKGEKKVLLWLAARMPLWINSDHLTVLGFVAQCAAGVAYVLSSQNLLWLHGVNVLMFFNWFGDSLDGTLARHRNKLRPRYGFYVDHICDTFGGLFLMGGLAFSGVMTPGIAWGMLIAFYIISIQVYLATFSIGKFKLSHFLFGPTEIRVLLIIGNLALFKHKRVHLAGYEFFLFDVGGTIAIIGMLGMAVWSSILNTRALYQMERLD
jgi:archaetidylinositol phosphate synthase